jgi:hypothetical protein
MDAKRSALGAVEATITLTHIVCGDGRRPWHVRRRKSSECGVRWMETDRQLGCFGGVTKHTSSYMTTKGERVEVRKVRVRVQHDAEDGVAW